MNRGVRARPIAWALATDHRRSLVNNLANSLPLRHQVALITGGARGIGAATAEALAHKGAHVIVASRSQVELTTTVAQLHAKGFSASLRVLDVADDRAVKIAFADIAAEFGRLDVLVNNAAIPVSYTHLDVYKRQDLPLPIEADAFLITALRWLTARVQSDDVILNFSYDWLPLFLGDYLPCPLATLISMGPVDRSMDLEIHRCAARHPEHVAFLSAAQAASFDMSNPIRLIAPGLELAQYPYNAHPGHAVGWLGRIAPEKGLEDIFALSARTGITVMVFGVMQQPSYCLLYTSRCV